MRAPAGRRQLDLIAALPVPVDAGGFNAQRPVGDPWLDSRFYAAVYTDRSLRAGVLDAYLLARRNDAFSDATLAIGARLTRSAGPLQLELEAAHERGRLGRVARSSWSARVGASCRLPAIRGGRVIFTYGVASGEGDALLGGAWFAHSALERRQAAGGTQLEARVELPLGW
jgi:hypothetical protein